jgi:hypothetical protein
MAQTKQPTRRRKTMSSIHYGKVELNSAKNIVEIEDEIIVPAILERESILQYGCSKQYRSAEALKAGRFTLEDSLIVAYQHTPTPHITRQEVIRGKVRSVTWNPEINGFLGELHFNKKYCDSELLNKVRAGTLNKDSSTAYFCTIINEPGEFGGQPYDARQEGIVFHHIAVGIPEGRCPSPYVGMMDSYNSYNDFLRVSVIPQHLFSRLSTIVVSGKRGIYALVGKLMQGTKDTVTCEYMFDKKLGWTKEKAEAEAKKLSKKADQTKNQTTQNSLDELPKTSEKLDNKLDPYTVLEESCKLLGLKVTCSGRGAEQNVAE